MSPFDPVERAKEIESIVVDDSKRKYYRVSRPGRWYGGIASADCCGCNLQCVFCWSDKPRENPGEYGRFYTPEEISKSIIQCARDHDYHLARISGNEPTIAGKHLLEVIRVINEAKLTFILETNGTLLDHEFLHGLVQLRKVHVRVSLKGASHEEFTMLTGAIPETFDRILDSLNLLLEHKINFNLAVMLSFSTDESIELLKARLSSIAPSVLDNFEEEYVILYPHVAQKLKKAGVRPIIAYTPGGVPKRLV